MQKDIHLEKADIIVNIQGDVPSVDPNVIDRLTRALLDNPNAKLSTPITLLQPDEAIRSSCVKCVI